jgi:bifunctional enzyme CysN/CysC
MTAVLARPEDIQIFAECVSKEHTPSLLRFLTCGSVDDGKSTLIGRLLYEAGAVYEDQIETLDRDSQKFGTTGGARDYALLVDGLSAEREQGITIDVAYRYFATPKRHFIVADTPGHEQYTRNMATGASTADVAVILIDARLGVLPQTRRHSFIVSMLGVRRVAVAINKMDLVAYSQSVYDDIVTTFKAAVDALGFIDCQFIPLSAREGDNIAKPSMAMPWYHGPTLLDWLEQVPARDISTASFEEGFGVFPVQWVNRPHLDFRGYAGTVAAGMLQKGDPVTLLPSGQRSTIARLITADGDLDSAYADQAVTITLQDEVDLSRGDMILSGNYARAGLQVGRVLQVHLLITDSVQVSVGQTYWLRLGTTHVQARIDAIDHQIDIETFNAVPASQLEMNKIGRVRLVLDRPVASMRFDHSATLGGLILIDRITNQTIAFGFVQPASVSAEPKKGLPLFVSRLRSLSESQIRLLQPRHLSLWFGHRLIVALLFWACGVSLAVTLAAVVVHAVLTSLFTVLHDAMWDRFGSVEFFDSGDGI